MGNIKDQLEELTDKSASVMTEAVAQIGGGSFLEGLKKIREDGVDEGIKTTMKIAKEWAGDARKSGTLVGVGIGAISVVIGGVLYKGAKWGRSKYKSRKHKRKEKPEN